MDIVTYALLKKKITAALAGINDIQIDGTNIIFTLSDGSQLTMTVPAPADGLDGNSIVGVEVNNENHLICTMSDGTIIDAGEISCTSGGNAADNLEYATDGDIDNLFPSSI